MLKREFVKNNLVPGTLYRRSELEEFSTSIDRHLAQLVKDGTLKKVGPGLYLHPEKSKWGEKSSEDRKLVEAFLKDDRFLMFSFNSYNGLGLGTTQLYNQTVVYNHKRHGKFKLGSRTFDFRMKPDFPTEFTKESLLVDMLNNLSELAEDPELVVRALEKKLLSFDRQSLENAVKLYGKVKTKKLIKELYGKDLPA
ncbi:MAG: hypothetical protein L6Q33_12700 [Bacteriovoracaceae bacterium]|nr:hypothetical protein [Bacteriovoracaceae bacterium]